MNKRLVSSKLIVSILTLFCLSLIAFSSSTAFAVNFDIGTLFGISRLSTTDSDNDNTLTYTRLPSGSLLDIVASPTALYAMFYPTKQFAIGPEFSYGSTSVTNVDLWVTTTQIRSPHSISVDAQCFSSPIIHAHHPT